MALRSPCISGLEAFFTLYASPRWEAKEKGNSNVPRETRNGFLKGLSPWPLLDTAQLRPSLGEKGLRLVVG